MESDPYGMDTADCCLMLANNIVIGIPFGLDEDVWIRNESDLAGKRLANTPEINSLKGSVITGLICYEDEDKAFMELDNGKIITEITMAPQGTGRAGLWIFGSLADLENRQGSKYSRLNIL